MKKMIAISILILAMVAVERGITFACVDYPDWMTTSVNLPAVQLPQTPPPETGAYPGAVNYKNETNSLFDCELNEVSYHFYHTADSAAKVVAFYHQRGFTVIRDDSVSTCCLSKMSYVLSGRQNGSTVYVTVERPWFDEKTHFMSDTLIVAAFAQ